MFNYLFYLAATKRHQSSDRMPETKSLPPELLTTYFKRYERFPLYELERPSQVKVGLTEAIMGRVSAREFAKSEGNVMSTLSHILFFGAGEISKDAHDGRGRRTYGSAGGRYPLELYVLVFEDCTDLGKGLYHYDVFSHGLRLLKQEVPTRDEVAVHTYHFFKNSQFAIYITGVMWRTTQKYGEHGYRLALLEAGSVMQNLALISTALSLAHVSSGRLVEWLFEPLLDIDGLEEVLLHAMYFGKGV